MLCPLSEAIQPKLAGLFTAAGAAALRAIILAAALVSYGAVPSGPAIPSEVESQLQEELASSRSDADYLAHLCSAASRFRARAVADTAAAADAPLGARQRVLSSPRVSAGLVLPLRC